MNSGQVRRRTLKPTTFQFVKCEQAHELLSKPVNDVEALVTLLRAFEHTEKQSRCVPPIFPFRPPRSGSVPSSLLLQMRGTM